MARLFYDDERQAIEAAIIDSGRSYKAVALALWPTRKPETAYARLKACLAHDGDVHLTLGEIIALCRYCDRFDPLYHMADELSHERPRLVTKEDELTGLLRRYLEIAGERDKLGARIEKIRSAA